MKMAKLTADDFIARLKHLAMNRKTYYDNTFPSNCGEINADGSISFDCIGLVKSVINEPDIAYKTSPAGYYVKPGQVIPDATEEGILYLCEGVSYDFKNIARGSYLYMAGHAGVYCGDFTWGVHTYNTIECTTDFGKNGVTASYVTTDGRRLDHKSGTPWRPWEAHGKLTKYIDYTTYKWLQKWHLYADGVMQTGWKLVKGKWYLLDKNGIMLTGWQKVNGKWYLMSGNGDMLTSWVRVNGKWYYLQTQSVDGYKEGEMRTGWLKDKNKWYYLDPKDGYMYTGTHIIGGKTYHFDNFGALIE